MKFRLNQRAIIELCVMGVVVIILVIVVRSAYNKYYLWSYMGEAVRLHLSGPKHYGNALKHLEEAKQFDPSYLPLYNIQGHIALNSKELRLKEAEEVYQQTLKRTQGSSDPFRKKKRLNALLGLATVLMYRAFRDGERRENLLSEAEAYLEKAGNLAPQNVDVSIFLWVLYSLHPRKGAQAKEKLVELEGHLEELAQKRRKSSHLIPSRGALLTYYFNRGWVERRRGNYREAVSFLEKAVRLDPGRRELSLELVRTLHLYLEHLVSLEKVERKELRRRLVEPLLFIERVVDRDRSGGNVYPGFLLGFRKRDLPPLFARLGLGFYKLRFVLGEILPERDVQKLSSSLRQLMGKRGLVNLEDILKRARYYFKQAYGIMKMLGTEDFSLVARARLYRWEIRALLEFTFASEREKSYSRVADLYLKIARMARLSKEVRYRAYINSAYYNGLLFYINMATDMAKKAQRLYPRRPQGWMVEGIAWEFFANRPSNAKSRKAYLKNALNAYTRALSELESSSDKALQKRWKAALVAKVNKIKSTVSGSSE